MTEKPDSTEDPHVSITIQVRRSDRDLIARAAEIRRLPMTGWARSALIQEAESIIAKAAAAADSPAT